MHMNEARHLFLLHNKGTGNLVLRKQGNGPFHKAVRRQGKRVGRHDVPRSLLQQIRAHMAAQISVGNETHKMPIVFHNADGTKALAAHDINDIAHGRVRPGKGECVAAMHNLFEQT